MPETVLYALFTNTTTLPQISSYKENKTNEVTGVK